MPSGWMIDAAHDTRMRPAWPAIARREQEKRVRRMEAHRRTPRGTRHATRPMRSVPA